MQRDCKADMLLHLSMEGGQYWSSEMSFHFPPLSPPDV